MNSTSGSSAGAGALPHEKAAASQGTRHNESAPALSLALHSLVFVVGLALLLTGHSLESVNSAMHTASGGGYPSTADSLRSILQNRVSGGALILLITSPIALLGTWCQARWPHLDKVSSRWRKRYGLPPPPEQRRWLARMIPLACGLSYGVALVRAFVPPAMAFHLVPGLYESGSVASSIAPGRAIELIQRCESVAVCLIFAVFLLLLATAAWSHSSRLRELESWLHRGVPVCLACGYPLRGLDSPACPECGAAWSQWYPSKDGRPVLPT
jgi:hypothetical protein